jgi:spermidine synthase
MQRMSFALFFIGFGSILSQILLVREFFVSFYGNELGIGIIFACWLIWIGLGSALGNAAVRRSRNISRLFLVLIAVTPLVTFAQILAVKFVRAFFHTASGEFLSMLDLMGFSFVVLSAGCMFWGMLFTLGAAVLSPEKDERWFGVNKAYILESLGSVAGGLLFSFYFAEHFSTLHIVFLVVLTASGTVLWSISSATKWIMLMCIAGLVIVFVVLLQPIRSLENKINATQWSFINDKLSFIGSLATKYQNLSLLSLENQHTLYADGRPVYSIPNTYEAELFTHSIMVHRVDAKRVLVLGGGFNGVLGEVLKYPVREVEYIEIDPALLPFVEPGLNGHDRQALHDSRVHILSVDGREYLRRTQGSFDVIVMNVGEPSTASVNRFYTEEYFQLCSRSLNGNGIFAFSFPSSAEYLTAELKDLNASLYRTFHHAFTNTLIIPGTHAVLIGTKSAAPLVTQPDSLARRYAAAGISTEYFSRYMFDEIMPPDRVKFITSALEAATDVRMNTDRNPVTYYYDLLLWNKFLQGSSNILFYITRFWIFIAGGVCSGLILLLILFQRKQPEKQTRTSLAAIMGICGMTGMALNLLLLLNFQSAFGSIYEMVGAMIAANMFGLAIGAVLASRRTGNDKQKTFLLAALTALLAVVILLPALLDFLLFAHLIPLTLFVTFMSGGLIGLIFGMVNRSYMKSRTTGGSVYAFDVLGSSLGALTTCSVLLPVLGIQETALFLVLILSPAFAALGYLHASP